MPRYTRIQKLLPVAGILPLMTVAFFWFRSHWWVDTAFRSGDGGTLILNTGGGLGVGWENSAWPYWWSTPSAMDYTFESPEWRLSVGDVPDDGQRTWFGAGPYAGANMTWTTLAGGTNWSISIPWWSLAILASAWAWLMWLVRRWATRKQAKASEVAAPSIAA